VAAAAAVDAPPGRSGEQRRQPAGVLFERFYSEQFHAAIVYKATATLAGSVRHPVPKIIKARANLALIALKVAVFRASP